MKRTGISRRQPELLMNEKALQTLEYPKIIRRLSDCAGSAPGREKCLALKPSNDPETIRRMQRETADAADFIRRRGRLSFSGLSDLGGMLRRLEVGSTLTAAELLRICSVMETAEHVKRQAGADSAGADSLTGLFESLQPLTHDAAEIRRCIVSGEEISDDASAGLRQVRRQIHQTNDKIRSSLNAYLAGPSRMYLQDTVITQRDGRSCIPVKAEYRAQVPGMIHDQSQSGATVYIEPTAIVRLNNDLRELQIRELREIDLVLASLSEEAAQHTADLDADCRILTELDFIFARAQLSLSYRGTEPVFNTEGRIDLKQARHPLLDPEKVVPVDIRLGGDFTLLVISGPNTGGKTVSLKTVGLLSLLGQSGLFIPAAEHSELSVFTEVYADIGDEQSIEQSLSTFSSHMTNIVSFWEHADTHSLVLFDELGAGTDPTEGAALAIAILSNLHRRNIRTIATTHYSELKVYALSTPGVENACCEFDVDTLRPTYRLLIGVPGKSNAFAISEKLGLPEEIIDEAKDNLSEQQEDFEDVIASLQTSRETIDQEQQEVARYKEEVEQLQQSLTRKQESMNESRDAILQQAHEEAASILQEAKDYADESIRRINRLGKEAGVPREMEQERTKLREKVNENSAAAGIKKEKKTGKALTAKDLRIGDDVRVLSLNLTGTVSTLPDQKGNLFVQMGILRSQVNLSDLEKLEEAPAPCRPSKSRESANGAEVRNQKSSTISAELNLIGKTTDEAIAELDKYLDDAYVAHLSPVRIVHGKGSGTLRRAVHQYLRRQSHVASFRLGEYGEGDTGVTIVEFK